MRFKCLNPIAYLPNAYCLFLIMSIVDTHAHLDHIEDLESVLHDAAEAEVTDIIAMSVDRESCQKTLALARQYSSPRIHPALGIHPGNIKSEEIDDTIALIKENLNQAIAVGEIGLDFWYKWVRKDKEKKDEQREVFRRLLQLSIDHDLPAVIHTRGTWKQALEITEEVGVKRAVFHWYSGPVDVLEKILEAGFYVSCSPSLASSPQSREAISHAPIERTLIETDSPVFFRDRDGEGGFKSTPKDVYRTLRVWSELKGVPEDEAKAIFNQNAQDFFRINNSV